MRDQVMEEMRLIAPQDAAEAARIDDARAWLASGVEFCRIKKPDLPPKHLVSYAVVVDGEFCLLVDHKLSGLWLPSGGHVEPGEHPRAAARREVFEELGISAGFARTGPVMLSQSVTVGQVAGHTDVSLWYAIAGDRHAPVRFDTGEFNDARWFHCDEIAALESDPFMGCFVRKFWPNARG